MPHWCCRTLCGCRRAVTPCLSSCCYHDIVISVNFAKSLKKKDCRGFVSPTSGSFQSHCGPLLLTGSRPEYPGRAPKARVFLWRRIVWACGSSRWCVVAISGLQKLSRGIPRLVTLYPMLPPPDSLSSRLPQSSPSSSTPYSFHYYKSVLLQRFRSTIGAAISLFLPVGVYPMVSSSVLCLSSPSVSLYRP